MRAMLYEVPEGKTVKVKQLSDDTFLIALPLLVHVICMS